MRSKKTKSEKEECDKAISLVVAYTKGLLYTIRIIEEYPLS